MAAFEDGSSTLFHYGTKGMKWGVRKARTGQVETITNRIAKKTDHLDRVARGTGSKKDKAVAIGNTQVYRLPRTLTKKGLASEAERTSERYKNYSDELKAHSKRLSTGQATVKDVLRAYGSVTPVDIARSIKKD